MPRRRQEGPHFPPVVASHRFSSSPLSNWRPRTIRESVGWGFFYDKLPISQIPKARKAQVSWARICISIPGAGRLVHIPGFGKSRGSRPLPRPTILLIPSKFFRNETPTAVLVKPRRLPRAANCSWLWRRSRRGHSPTQ